MAAHRINRKRGVRGAAAGFFSFKGVPPVGRRLSARSGETASELMWTTVPFHGMVTSHHGKENRGDPPGRVGSVSRIAGRYPDGQP